MRKVVPRVSGCVDNSHSTRKTTVARCEDIFKLKLSGRIISNSPGEQAKDSDGRSGCEVEPFPLQKSQ